jgi:hypothetical protein
VQFTALGYSTDSNLLQAGRVVMNGPFLHALGEKTSAYSGLDIESVRDCALCSSNLGSQAFMNILCRPYGILSPLSI